VRIADELGCEVVMVDISPRMVELARQRGVEAEVGDAQNLPYPDAAFDCVIAAWMLFHLPDIDAGLAELARVLKPGGRLVAATNSVEPHEGAAGDCRRRQLGTRLHTRKRRRDDRQALRPSRAPGHRVRGFVASLEPDAMPELPAYDLPIRCRRASSVFVATNGRG
jgi:SAM-dependent methyltransferase